MKLCCIFNIPSLYREKIYKEIDKEYDCEWYFEEEDNDINVFDIKELHQASLLEHRRFLSRFYQMKGLIGRLWKRNDFDAYLMIGAPMCISIWILCLLLRIFYPSKKIYFWTHGWYGKESKSEAIVKKAFLKLAHGLFLYGNYAKEQLVSKGFKSENLHVLHNSLSYDVQLTLRNSINESSVYKEHFNNDNPVIVFIGRLTPIKQLDMLLKAISKLTKAGKKFNLALIGNGSMRQSLEQSAKELEMIDKVWFYGACYDEKVNAELVYHADLCVSPGNVGLTAIHSMMFGTPVITHNNFAYQMPEFEAIRRSETGDFFEQGSIDSLALSIENWFVNKSGKRLEVRNACFKEIDEQWNPYFQMKVFKSVLRK